MFAHADRALDEAASLNESRMKYRYTPAVASLLLSALACDGKTPRAAAHEPNHGVTAGPLVTLDGFEGEIALTAKGSLGGAPPPSRIMNVTVLVKAGHLRVPLPDLLPVTAGLGMAYLLVFPEKKDIYAVSDNKRQTTVVGLDELLAYSESQDDAAAPPSPNAAPSTSAEKSQVAVRVAGYPCESSTIQLAAVTVNLCVAKLPVSWMRIPLGATAAKYPWAAELTDGNHFPLRVVTSLRGVEQGRIEVTHIEKKPVASSGLQVPPGYALTTLEQLLHSFTLDTAPVPSAR